MPLQEKGRMCKFVRRGVRKWEREREREKRGAGETRNIARDKRCKMEQRRKKIKKMKREGRKRRMFRARETRCSFLLLRSL